MELLDKKVLDPCCGSKMFYFDKQNPDVVFGDVRKEKHILCDGRALDINPDVLMDFRAMPFPDGSFQQFKYGFDLAIREVQAAQQKESVDIDADQLSNFIRKIDGNNSMGAGALAEHIVGWLKTTGYSQQKDGFVCVPVEPTPKMIDATWNYDDEIQGMSHNTRNKFIYEAMIQAAQEGE